MTVVGEPAGASTLLGWSDERLPYVEPDELLGEIRADASPLDWQVLSEEEHFGSRVTEVRFPTEVFAGRQVFMHAYICRPPADLLPPLLLVPGGHGALDVQEAAWHATKIGCCVLSVDWIGVGGSSRLGLEPPAAHAFRFGDGDFRTSYQFHNLRAFVQATDVLLAQPHVDAGRLAVAGSSWGGFYSLLLAGLDRRFRHARPVFGCGFLEQGCNQLWQAQLESMAPGDVEQWRRAFDPGRRAHLIEADVVYIQATNDHYFGLEGTMRTYKEIAGPKRLVLAHNQDHTAHPYHRLSVDAVSAQQAGRLDEVAPEVEARWLPGAATASVSVGVPPEAVDAVAICHSSGSYGPWCARVWRRAEARWDGERWVAEIPVVDPDREVWFYGHADLANGGVSSSPVGRAVPREQGFTTATGATALRYDFSAERPYDLPVGDPTEPPKRIVEMDGVTGVELTFEDGNYLRGAAPCIEGDLVAAGSYTGVELLVRVEHGSDPDGLAVGVFTDYGTLEEQAYGVPLRSRVTRTGAWERVEFAFHELVWQSHRIYPIGEPRAARPLDLSRCCAIGVLRSDVDYEGTVSFASIRLVPAEDES
jgi:hypothetical protein